MVAYDIATIASQLGMPVWLFAIIMIWSLAWKLAALWKAARKRSLFWFIILALVNTVGILEILYIFVFSEWDKTGLVRQRREKPAKKVVKKKTSKKKR